MLRELEWALVQLRRFGEDKIEVRGETVLGILIAYGTSDLEAPVASLSNCNSLAVHLEQIYVKGALPYWAYPRFSMTLCAASAYCDSPKPG